MHPPSQLLASHAGDLKTSSHSRMRHSLVERQEVAYSNHQFSYTTRNADYAAHPCRFLVELGHCKEQLESRLERLEVVPTVPRAVGTAFGVYVL